MGGGRLLRRLQKRHCRLLLRLLLRWQSRMSWQQRLQQTQPAAMFRIPLHVQPLNMRLLIAPCLLPYMPQGARDLTESSVSIL